MMISTSRPTKSSRLYPNIRSASSFILTIAAVGVDHENGIRRGVDQAAEVALALIAPLDLGAKMFVAGRQFSRSLTDSVFEFRACVASASTARRREALSELISDGRPYKRGQLNQSRRVEGECVDRRDQEIVGGQRAEYRGDETRAESAYPGTQHHGAEEKRIRRCGAPTTAAEEAES